ARLRRVRSSLRRGGASVGGPAARPARHRDRRGRAGPPRSGRLRMTTAPLAVVALALEMRAASADRAGVDGPAGEPSVAELVVVGAAVQPSPEARRALAALRGLPDTYRETMIMRLVEGMTGPEIALRTGMTPDSVRVHLHRGMQLLRERLGAAGGSES